jgi:hypothetical protein
MICVGHEDICSIYFSGVIAHSYLDCLSIYKLLCCLQLRYILPNTHVYIFKCKRKAPLSINNYIQDPIRLQTLWQVSLINHQWTQHYNQQIATFSINWVAWIDIGCMGMIIAWVLVPYQAHSAHYLESKSTIVNFITITTHPLFFRVWSTSSFGSLG